MVGINVASIRATAGDHLILEPSTVGGANTGDGSPRGANGPVDMEITVAATVMRITTQYPREDSLAAPVGMNGQTIGFLLKKLIRIKSKMRRYHYVLDAIPELVAGHSSDERHYNFETDAPPGTEGYLTYVSWVDPVGGIRKEAEWSVGNSGQLVSQLLDGDRAYGMMGTVRLVLPEAPPDEQ